VEKPATPGMFDSHPTAAPGKFDSPRAARFVVRSCGWSRGRVTRFAAGSCGGAGAGHRRAEPLHSLSQSSVPAGGGARGESRRLAGGPQLWSTRETREEQTGTEMGTATLLSHRDQGAAGPPPPCPTALRRRAVVPCQGARSNYRIDGRRDRHTAGGLTFLRGDSFSLSLKK
jgi:hypothetical protein